MIASLNTNGQLKYIEPMRALIKKLLRNVLAMNTSDVVVFVAFLLQ
jgi:hypothetical protein